MGAARKKSPRNTQIAGGVLAVHAVIEAAAQYAVMGDAAGTTSAKTLILPLFRSGLMVAFGLSLLHTTRAAFLTQFFWVVWAVFGFLAAVGGEGDWGTAGYVVVAASGYIMLLRGEPGPWRFRLGLGLVGLAFLFTLAVLVLHVVT